VRIVVAETRTCSLSSSPRIRWYPTAGLPSQAQDQVSGLGVQTRPTRLRPLSEGPLYAARPSGRASFEQFARVLTLIAVWAHQEGMALDVEVVLDPDTVERFFSEGLRDLPSRGTYRTTLRRLGRALTRKAPWQPRPEPMRRRKVALPYTAAELAALQEDARHQSTASRRRGATALIALGAGAGLDGRWVTKVHGTDVRRVGSVVVVRVGHPRPRDVPVLDQFEEEVLRLAAEAGDELLIGGSSSHRNRTNLLVKRLEVGHRHPRLSVPRLRSTWIVEHLSRGTRLPEQLTAAGNILIETFDQLLEFVPPLEEEHVRRMLRGDG
jgi:hypothetical protein